MRIRILVGDVIETGGAGYLVTATAPTILLCLEDRTVTVLRGNDGPGGPWPMRPASCDGLPAARSGGAREDGPVAGRAIAARASTWAALRQQDRTEIERRLAYVQPFDEAVRRGWGREAAYRRAVTCVRNRALAAPALREKAPPSLVTLRRWHGIWRKAGCEPLALAPRHPGTRSP